VVSPKAEPTPAARRMVAAIGSPSALQLIRKRLAVWKLYLQGALRQRRMQTVIALEIAFLYFPELLSGILGYSERVWTPKRL
jgi:hypothetical protein